MALVVALVAAWPGPAQAYDFEVFARTEGHGYQLRRYNGVGVTLLNRRTLTQYLGVRVFNLLDPGQSPYVAGTRQPPALIWAHALMRFQTEFAGYMEHGGRVPELENNQLDLMLGAVEGRNLWGRVDFTLGRQFDMELLDFFAFDGLKVRINLPWSLHVESLFGLQVARAQPFSAAVFQTDGTSDDGTDEALSPTFGLALGWRLEPWLDLRLAYRGAASMARRVPPRAGTADDDDRDTVWGIDQELLFLGLQCELPWLDTRVGIGLRYNMLLGQLDDVQLSLIQRLGQRHQAQLEALHSRPHFDGDSIFNIFATEPYTEVAARYSLRILHQLGAHARFGYRRMWAPDDPQAAAGDDNPDAFSMGLGAWWRSWRLRATADVFALGGHGGTTVGGDLQGQWDLLSRLTLQGRASLIDFHGAGGQVSADGLNLGLQLGARLRLFKGVLLHVLFEDNISPQYRSALRLLGVLDLEFAP